MIGRVLRFPLLIGEQAVGYAALGAVFFWWLGFPESGRLAVLVSMATLVLIAAGAVVLARRARQRLASPSPASAADGVVSVLLFVAALTVAYFAVGWVPELSGFTAQAISMAVRWGGSYLLVIVAWLNLLAATSAGRPVASQPSTAALP